jgi:hypothetical protein
MTMAAVLGTETVHDRRSDPFCFILDRMRHDLMSKLWTGELESFAFVKGSDATSERIRIHPGRWRVLTPNFDDCTASGDGIELSDIWVAAPRSAIPMPVLEHLPASVTPTLNAEATAPPSPGTDTPAITHLDRKEISMLSDETILNLLEEHADRVIAGPDATLIAPGRISLLPIVKRKMRHRAERDELLPTLTAESKWLAQWIDDKLPSHHTPSAGTISKVLSPEYWQLKPRSKPAI